MGRNRSSSGWVAPAAAVFALCAIAAMGGAARAQSPPPSPAPADTRPASSPSPDATSADDLMAIGASLPSRPAMVAIETAATVDEALALTDEERTVLSDVRDGDSQLDEAARYVLLRRAAMLPVSREPLARADAVPVGNLMADPAHYRGRLVRLGVRVWIVTERPSTELSPTRWWAGRPIWRIDCTDQASGSPLIVYLAAPPEGFRQGSHDTGPRVTVAGVFYKLVRLSRREGPPGEPATQLYPVLVADALYGAGGVAGEPAGRLSPMMQGLFAVLLVLLVGYIALRWAVGRHKRRRRAIPWSRPAERSAEQTPLDEAVDEALVREVLRSAADRHEET